MNEITSKNLKPVNYNLSGRNQIKFCREFRIFLLCTHTRRRKQLRHESQKNLQEICRNCLLSHILMN